MSNYRINAAVISPENPDFQDLLRSAYQARLRPMCLCKGEPGIPMYIALVNDRFWLKRMPNSGQEHAMGCGSWDMPEELSGRKDVFNSGVTYEGDEVRLKFDFSLTKIAGRTPPAPATGAGTSVKAAASRLTLQGLLHFLWEEAGLTKWPGMGTRRDYAFVYSSLTAAMQQKSVGKDELENHVLLPEPDHFKSNPYEISPKIQKMIDSIAIPDGKQGHHLLIALGELEDELPAAGYASDFPAMLAHFKNRPFLVNEKTKKGLDRRYGGLNELWTGQRIPGRPASHMVVIGTFSASVQGSLRIEEWTQMLVDENWIPYDSLNERDLLRQLILEKRSFQRPLRYNRHDKIIMPSYMLTDTAPKPCAIFLAPSDQLEETRNAVKLAARISSEGPVHEDGHGISYDYLVFAVGGKINLPPKQVSGPASVAGVPASRTNSAPSASTQLRDQRQQTQAPPRWRNTEGGPAGRPAARPTAQASAPASATASAALTSLAQPSGSAPIGPASSLPVSGQGATDEPGSQSLPEVQLRPASTVEVPQATRAETNGNTPAPAASAAAVESPITQRGTDQERPVQGPPLGRPPVQPGSEDVPRSEQPLESAGREPNGEAAATPAPADAAVRAPAPAASARPGSNWRERFAHRGGAASDSPASSHQPPAADPGTGEIR